MITSVQQWVMFLQGSEALMGFPLLIVGALLLLGGWRLWKVCTSVTFGIIGGVIGLKMASDPSVQVMYCLAGAVILGTASFPPANYSVAVLGGLIAGTLVHAVLTSFWLHGVVLWTLVALAFGVATALAYINLRHVVILITSFEGAVLIVSGCVAILSDYPQVYSFFRTIAGNYSFFLPFLLLVPTVVGCMLQMADVRQRDAGMASQ